MSTHTKSSVKKIKLGLLNEDATVMIRKIDTHTVSRFVEALRSGAELPPLLINEQTKIVVGGYHRLKAYRIFSKDDSNYLVPVEEKKYKNIQEMMLDAVKDNSIHGLPLTAWDQKNAIFKAIEIGIDLEDIATALAITMDKAEKWHSEKVTVLERENGKVVERERPLKGGLSNLNDTKIKKGVYNDIQKKYSGWSPDFHIKQILMHIDNKTIDIENEKTKGLLIKLNEVISDMIGGWK